MDDEGLFTNTRNTRMVCYRNLWGYMIIALIAFICIAGFYLDRAWKGDEDAWIKSILFSVLGLVTAIYSFINQ